MRKQAKIDGLVAQIADYTTKRRISLDRCDWLEAGRYGRLIEETRAKLRKMIDPADGGN